MWFTLYTLLLACEDFRLCLHGDLTFCGHPNRYRIFPNLAVYDNTQSLLGDLCEKPSLTGITVSAYLHCIKNRMDNSEQCFMLAQNADDIYEQYLISQTGAKDRKWRSDEEHEKAFCLMQIYTLSCLAEDISLKCSESAGEAILQISRQAILPDVCSVEVRMGMPSLVTELDLTPEEKEHINDFLQT